MNKEPMITIAKDIKANPNNVPHGTQKYLDEIKAMSQTPEWQQALLKLHEKHNDSQFGKTIRKGYV